eukprot:Skav224061  [mRNA]  locus=scaffold534:577021:578630:- [translate_table: standard]
MAWAEAEALFGMAQSLAEAGKPLRKASEAADESLRLARDADDEVLMMHSMQVGDAAGGGGGAAAAAAGGHQPINLAQRRQRQGWQMGRLEESGMLSSLAIFGCFVAEDCHRYPTQKIGTFHAQG